MIEQLRPGSGDALAEVEALAAAMFHGGEALSVTEEMSRPWSRLWSLRPSEGEPVAAFLVAWHVADELHIINVATAPAARRRGFGSELVQAALGYAKEHRIRILLLEVRRSNRPAIKLYRSFGFVAMGVRKAYYSDNDEDAVEMALGLDPTTGERLAMRDEIHVDGAGEEH